MNELRATRHWRSIEHWPERLRITHHVVLGGLIFVLGFACEAAGSAWRTAAQHGNPFAHASREIQR